MIKIIFKRQGVDPRVGSVGMLICKWNLRKVSQGFLQDLPWIEEFIAKHQASRKARDSRRFFRITSWYLVPAGVHSVLSSLDQRYISSASLISRISLIWIWSLRVIQFVDPGLFPTFSIRSHANAMMCRCGWFGCSAATCSDVAR